MGAWGVAVFSDDLAVDLREDFRDLIGEGLSSSQAVDKLIVEYASSLEDGDEQPVFWIALAATQWKLGRLEERTRKEALRVIDTGQDLQRWDDSKDRQKRAAVLQKVREQLLTPPPPPKRVPRTVKGANEWPVGEVVGLRLKSGRWTLLRAIGHHEDKGGRYAVCELLDWVGDELPTAERVAELGIKREANLRGISQFLFQDPIKAKDQARIKRLGFQTAPAQSCDGYTALVWPYVDRQLKELFGLE